MKLSTKGRYGMRIMLDLALQQEEEWASVRDISARQKISNIYAEQILTRLKASGLVSSIAGPKGGFALIKKPSETTLGEILEAVEGSFDLVECVNNPSACSRSATCLTRHLWTAIFRAIDDVLSHSLQDLVDGNLYLVGEGYSENANCFNPVNLDCSDDAINRLKRHNFITGCGDEVP